MKPHCQACVNEKYGVKTRVDVPHICEKSDSKYLPPIIRKNSEGNDEVLVYVTSAGKLFDTGKATKWKLKNGQWINGYKVRSSNNEVWIPNHIHIHNGKFVEQGVWVEKSFYDKMAFI